MLTQTKTAATCANSLKLALALWTFITSPNTRARFPPSTCAWASAS